MKTKIMRLKLRFLMHRVVRLSERLDKAWNKAKELDKYLYPESERTAQESWERFQKRMKDDGII